MTGLPAHSREASSSGAERSPKIATWSRVFTLLALLVGGPAAVHLLLAAAATANG